MPSWLGKFLCFLECHDYVEVESKLPMANTAEFRCTRCGSETLEITVNFIVEN